MSNNHLFHACMDLCCKQLLNKHTLAQYLCQTYVCNYDASLFPEHEMLVLQHRMCCSLEFRNINKTYLGYLCVLVICVFLLGTSIQITAAFGVVHFQGKCSSINQMLASDVQSMQCSSKHNSKPLMKKWRKNYLQWLMLLMDAKHPFIEEMCPQFQVVQISAQ